MYVYYSKKMEPRLQDVSSFFFHLIFKKINIAIRKERWRGGGGEGEREGERSLVSFVLLMHFVLRLAGSFRQIQTISPGGRR